MKVTETKLPDVKLIEPSVFGDSRGYFKESWNLDRYTEHGLPHNFVQDNASFSSKGILRGLHFQNPHGQGKLVSVLQGEVFDVAVDVRVNSPSFGEWVGLILSSQNHHQLFIPDGFAHGFCTLSETALFSYKCTEYYHPEAEQCILWKDTDLSIDWPIKQPLVSDKDDRGHTLVDLPKHTLPVY